LKGCFLPAKCPERRQIRLSKQLLIVLYDFPGCAVDEEINLELASESDVAEGRTV